MERNVFNANIKITSKMRGRFVTEKAIYLVSAKYLPNLVHNAQKRYHIQRMVFKRDITAKYKTT